VQPGISYRYLWYLVADHNNHERGIGSLSENAAQRERQHLDVALIIDRIRRVSDLEEKCKHFLSNARAACGPS
jgi:hypothetical protein